jgi:hypothetical protein
LSKAASAALDEGFMLPKPLYEIMPVLYIAVGFAAALLLYNSYAIISGILLVTVALMILYMRLKSRTEAVGRFDRLKRRAKAMKRFEGPKRRWDD